MTRSKQRLLDFYASKSWAILEANLQEMYQIYQAALERKAIDSEFNPEAVAAKLGRPLDNARTVTVRDGVAIVPVSGPVFRYANLFTEISGATSIEVLARDFRQALDDRAVRAIVLEINSPGGEVDGTSELAQHIFDARGQKPIVAYVSNLGASAAYWLASAAEEIVVNDTASLGSIGVVGAVHVHKNPHRLEFVSSQSPNKRPNPETEAGRSEIQQHIDALAQVFIDTVARNREMDADTVIAQGGAGGLKVGQKAVEAGLADRMGTLEGVIAELSDATKPFIPRPRKNINNSAVLQNGADGKPLTTGVDTMADENDNQVKNADLDKTIGERISAFFQEKFGASSTPATPLPVDGKADEQLEANRIAVEKAQAEAEAAKKEAAEAKTQIASLQKDARATRFQALSKGWPGDNSTHVAMLEHLSQSAGEDSELFKGYIALQNASAEQVKQSALFAEVGSSAPAEGSAEAQLNGMIAEQMKADPALTREQAFDKVWQGTNPTLRSQYREEQKRSVN